MTEEDITQDFILKKITEINNYFIKEIDHKYIVE